MNKLKSIIIGLLGLSFIILVHESGHFIACKLFNVDTPVFSIGFGPALIQKKIGATLFQIAILPIGGYVSIASADYDAQPYLHKIIITLAGIIFNFLFALLIFFYITYISDQHSELRILSSEDQIKYAKTPRLKLLGSVLSALFAQKGYHGFVGPIGIITITGASYFLGIDIFLFSLAMISINIGILNLLPIPFFDGGQLASATFKAIPWHISKDFNQTIYITALIVMIMIIILTILEDIARQRN